VLNSYLTADMPGVGGRIKVCDADFVVEEIPLYAPCGEGEHTYITFQKEGLSTFSAVNRIARALGVEPRSVGYAGLKDAHAVTTQTISVGRVEPERARELDLPGIRVLEVSRHTNKLRLGHLRGNRFTIRVRDVSEDSLPAARAILDALGRQGVPNFFGEQRFGLRGDTHLLGQALVRGDAKTLVTQLVGHPSPIESPTVRRARELFESGDLAASLRAWPAGMESERRALRTLLDHPGDWGRAVRSIPRKMLKFFVSAYQSALFNRILAQRMETLGCLLEGDLAWIHGKGAVFLVEDPVAEQPRADRLEISPSGPLYGYKLTMAQGEPGRLERQVLEEEGLEMAAFRRRECKSEGVRRPLRFPLYDARVWYEAGVMVSFVLPPGCYATVVLAELTKTG